MTDEKLNPLAEVLRRHGVGPSLARTVEMVGEELRLRTQSEGAEFAAMIDADDGSRLGGLLAGRASLVGITTHLYAMQRGHEYVQIHTHPRNSAFSPQDATILAAYTAIRVMLVTGVDGTWYALSRLPGTTAPGPVAILDAYESEVVALRPEYEERVRAGALDPRVAWREHSHDVWRRIAGRLAFRYDRVEPETR